MDANELKQLISSFEENIEDVEILKDVSLGETASLVVARLTYSGGEGKPYAMIVPFIYYDGEDWLFTPYDWDDYYDETFGPDRITDVEWHYNNTEHIGIMLAGLPRLF